MAMAASSSSQSARVAQSSADAELNAVFERSKESQETFDYAKAVSNKGGDGESVRVPGPGPGAAPGQTVGAYLQSMQRGGVTQSFGCMMAVEEGSFAVLAYSENAIAMLDVEEEEEEEEEGEEVEEGILGRDARSFFTPDSVLALEKAADADDVSMYNPIPVRSKGSGKSFDAVVHHSEVGLLLDLEPAASREEVEGEGGAGLCIQEKSVSRIQGLAVGETEQLCETVVEEVLGLTDYDRVMVYKFHPDEHGEVVAERRRSDMVPYVGYHYPATDIPQASRFLFMKERVRMICDCYSTPVRIVQSRQLRQAISLAGSSLRSPHACHAEYMGNMGSIASLVMAVIINDPDAELRGSRKLWGLVVCHHREARSVPYSLRQACVSIMQAFAEQLNMGVEQAAEVREKRIRRNESILCDLLLRELPMGIVSSSSPNMMDLVKCSGAALVHASKTLLLGTTPSQPQISQLCDWVMAQHKEEAGVFTTDSLVNSGFPGAEDLGESVCGVAAARIGAKDFLFWFRSQTAKEMKWGGAKHDPTSADDGRRMHPRLSFQAFSEVVKGMSVPFEELEKDAMHSLQLILRQEETCAGAAAAPSRKFPSSFSSSGGGGGWPSSLAREWIEAMRSSETKQQQGLDSSTADISGDARDVLSSFHQHAFVVTDGRQKEMPIIYASPGFLTMTGYAGREEEVIGKNCRFLQGSQTDQAEVARIRAALRDAVPYCGRLVNYKRDCSSFWNLLTIVPVKDPAGNIIHHVGMQVDVTRSTDGSNGNRIRPNGLPQSLIRYDAREKEKVSGLAWELVMALTHPDKMQRLMKPPLAPPVRHTISDKKAVQQQQQQLRSRRPWSLSSQSDDADAWKFSQPDVIMVDEQYRRASLHAECTRRGVDLGTTLERIEESFVVTDPRLRDNPIIFASDKFLELTEYTREDVLGKNCRFLQGPLTDAKAVEQIRDAVRKTRDITVRIINYTKSGRAFWNLVHLQAMRDQTGVLQYLIGVQQECKQHPVPKEKEVVDVVVKKGREEAEEEVEVEEDSSSKVVKASSTARMVDAATRELPDANLTPDALWVKHSKRVTARPHKMNSPMWHAIWKVQRRGERLGLKHFRPIKPLGKGATGTVYLVELRGSGLMFAMKAMDKAAMLMRNKVHRAGAEREILAMVDHPFLPTLYASFQSKTHVYLITDFCAGGELFLLQEEQPGKVFTEEAARFYAAEVVIAIEYLHCMGVIYRDLKPENVLLQDNGHILLTDFDLSFLTSSRPHLIAASGAGGGGNRRRRRRRGAQQVPIFCAQPSVSSNSFVGTEEYIAPEVIGGGGHSAAVDWWALGILLYEMLYGRTPFRGRNRHHTFLNILHNDLTFPTTVPVSLAARQLIRGLLQRDPNSRLGGFRGANDIKQHPFFRGFQWPLIRCRHPPPLEQPPPPSDPTAPMLEWHQLESSSVPNVGIYTDVF